MVKAPEIGTCTAAWLPDHFPLVLGEATFLALRQARPHVGAVAAGYTDPIENVEIALHGNKRPIWMSRQCRRAFAVKAFIH